ncbi:MAG: sporulation integral membrane protein YlbJ [Candidatus Syntrophonatronum acetioxidans]|uniref:Sporulation integral membrane protein YlbJ n=1 Tax=Candidatus Syntrophonatronum acetioxidans TaxID=1795816 RepID=A0A424YA97_9FIRM|nr:MAG: sporulation integral membrane protein YlbJ [Candidatus Syntrophonatronum acetioxidans]
MLSMLIKPALVFQGAVEGLKIWWEIILPSLLPFWIISEILMKLGFVTFLGVLMEPIMRPLFNVPGEGGFVVAMGISSGAPVNSMITTELYRKKICTKNEAHRLMSFTAFSSPLFMLSAVAVGMFNQPELGIVIAGGHYLASFFLGLTLVFLYPGKARSSNNTCPSGESSLVRAFKALLRHQRREKKGFGKLMGDSLSSAAFNLINIGSFMVIFTVIIKLFNEAELLNLLSSGLGFLFSPFNFSPNILTALARGFFETTLGSRAASQALAPSLEKITAVAIMLGWSGLSVQAQVASTLYGTDLSMKPFVAARILHALLASLFTWLLFYSGLGLSFLPLAPVLAPLKAEVPLSPWCLIIFSLKAGFITITSLIILSSAISHLKRK